MTRRKQTPDVSIVRSSAAEYLTFVAATGSNEQAVEMRYEDENIWLSQKMMATLYDVTIPAINQHLKRIFADRELAPDAVIKQLLTTAADGKTYNVKHYSLQAIIAVGFKIENERVVTSTTSESRAHAWRGLRSRHRAAAPQRHSPSVERSAWSRSRSSCQSWPALGCAAIAASWRSSSSRLRRASDAKTLSSS